MLTNDPLGWCRDADEDGPRGGWIPERSLAANRETVTSKRRTPSATCSYGYMNCATVPAHYFGGQYLSRAHRGDPGAAAAGRSRAARGGTARIRDSEPVPVQRERVPRAAADSAALVLLGMGRLTDTPAGKATAICPNGRTIRRHATTFRLSSASIGEQLRTVDYLFMPLVLARIDENPVVGDGAHDVDAGSVQLAALGDLRRSRQRHDSAGPPQPADSASCRNSAILRTNRQRERPATPFR